MCMIKIGWPNKQMVHKNPIHFNRSICGPFQAILAHPSINSRQTHSWNPSDPAWTTSISDESLADNFDSLARHIATRLCGKAYIYIHIYTVYTTQHMIYGYIWILSMIFEYIQHGNAQASEICLNMFEQQILWTSGWLWATKTRGEMRDINGLNHLANAGYSWLSKQHDHYHWRSNMISKRCSLTLYVILG